jgi:uncharacterized membrane protein YecN with MAPEG domain
MSVPITALYASLLGLLLIALAVPVIRLRRVNRVDVGDGGNQDLLRAIRVHGNAAEHVPIALILMLVYELNQGSPAVLHAYGGLFFLARALHAWGLSRIEGPSFGRTYGVLGTWIVVIGLAVANLLRLF